MAILTMAILTMARLHPGQLLAQLTHDRHEGALRAHLVREARQHVARATEALVDLRRLQPRELAVVPC